MEQINRLYNNKSGEISDDLKNVVASLSPTQKKSLCSLYCVSNAPQSNLCNLVGCESFMGDYNLSNVREYNANNNSPYIGYEERKIDIDRVYSLMNNYFDLNSDYTDFQADETINSNPTESSVSNNDLNFGYNTSSVDNSVRNIVGNKHGRINIVQGGQNCPQNCDSDNCKLKRTHKILKTRNVDGEINVFAPYIVVDKEKNQTNAYLLEDPRDPRYQRFLYNLRHY